MPINGPLNFDPCDEDKWFFGFMSRSDASELLSANETGAFIVRESTTAKGDLVLSVKERDYKVSHYIINRICSGDKNSQVRFKIGDQIFYDVPTLLTFYMMDPLDDTLLKTPAIPKNTVGALQTPKRSFTRDYLAEVQSQENKRSSLNDNKNVSKNMQRHLPSLAEVIQSRIPNAYDKTALTLRKGDLVKVTKMNVSGCWEGEVAGRKGHFPFNYVKFIEDQNE